LAVVGAALTIDAGSFFLGGGSSLLGAGLGGDFGFGMLTFSYIGAPV
jgi:hypothetical protein